MRRGHVAILALVLASCGSPPAPEPVEVKLPGRRGVSFLARGPDRTIWFSRFGTARVGFVREEALFPVEEIRLDDPSCSPAEIVAGPGGRIWIGTWSDTRILSVDAQPPHSVFETDTRSFGKPSHLALGPDGRIWFTEGGRFLGHINPARPLLAEGARQDVDLDLGALASTEETLWIACFLSDALAIVVDGQARRYVGARGCKPILATASPEGAVWFACKGEPLALRVSAGLDLRVVSRPAGSASIVAMTADDRGMLWILREKSASLSRVGPDGSVDDVLPLPVDMKAPSSLVFDHDGNLWVGDREAPRLVRLLPRAATSDPSP